MKVVFSPRHVTDGFLFHSTVKPLTKAIDGQTTAFVRYVREKRLLYLQKSRVGIRGTVRNFTVGSRGRMGTFDLASNWRGFA
ncbi:hypothetical protein OUZ56_022920 [Daphnia magna]|uniref:Uncharacterized protein n=1 Tax=Daphnia magna TaxID=35525 RepID=A0ABR0AXV8_9CRUS|nr:hypothetical protein OUZ56_022920 [Daphnia magna]